MGIRLARKRLVTATVRRFFSCSEITRSKARSMVSVSVPARRSFWARLILRESRRKCLWERGGVVGMGGRPQEEYWTMSVHKTRKYEHPAGICRLMESIDDR